MVKLLANFILILHFFYVIFILGGLLYIFFGIFFKWSGIRNPVFRYTHLAAMGVVIFETIFGIFCPLTELEATLRQAAGESFSYPQGFLAYWIHQILYYNWPVWIFTIVYITIFFIIISLFFVIPPYRKSLRQNLNLSNDTKKSM